MLRANNYSTSMKKLLSFILIITMFICVALSSCASNQGNTGYDSYLEGIERGKQDMFIDLWMASSDVAILHFGDTWETEHFTLEIKGKRKTEVQYDTNAPYIEFNLTLHGITIEECAMRDKMFFNIYSVTDGNWNMVLGYDDYYTYTALQHLDGNNGNGDVRIYEDADFLVVIIVIDSSIYTARYYVEI